MSQAMKERGINVEQESRLIAMWREGKGVSVIASALGKPAGTVKYRVERLMKRGVLR